MRTLDLRRHSTKDGDVKDTIGPQGLALAHSEGLKASTVYSKGFHGPLIRTCQTLYAFAEGLGYVPEPQPAMAELGDDDLFVQIATPEFREAVKGGATYFQALLATHGEPKAKEWAATAAEGICKMFDVMVEGEDAVAFGHSPLIELVIWRLLGYDLPAAFQKLGDMEGVSLYKESGGGISVGAKIVVEK